MGNFRDRLAESRSAGLRHSEQRVRGPAEVEPVGDDREREATHAAIVEQESEVGRADFDLSHENGAESSAVLLDSRPENLAGARTGDLRDGRKSEISSPESLAHFFELLAELLG